MDQLFDQMFRADPKLAWQMVALCLLFSFVLCQLIAAVYSWTFRGLSYSRGFVVSLALTGVVATLLMLAVGTSVARGLGLLGTLAIIRFRSTLRDVRDMMFVFASLAVGISVGVQAFSVAAVGTVFFCLFVVHLTFAPFGSRRQYDGLLRLTTPSDPHTDDALRRLLGRHCSTFVLVNLREIAQGSLLEHAYQIKLREPSYRDKLLAAIRTLEGIEDVSLLFQDPAMEV